jgi:hypothetical protein
MNHVTINRPEHTQAQDVAASSLRPAPDTGCCSVVQCMHLTHLVTVTHQRHCCLQTKWLCEPH